jgi:hypothetical protein
MLIIGESCLYEPQNPTLTPTFAMNYAKSKEQVSPNVSSSEKNHYWEDWFARYNTLMERLKSDKQDIRY